MKQPIPYPVLIGLLALLAAALAFASMLVGPAAAGTFDLLKMMSGGDSDTAWMIMREVRLPRTLLALMEGVTLGLGGAVLQGLLRNPLADPALIGVSSGAALGAVSIRKLAGIELAGLDAAASWMIAQVHLDEPEVEGDLLARLTEGRADREVVAVLLGPTGERHLAAMGPHRPCPTGEQHLHTGPSPGGNATCPSEGRDEHSNRAPA